MKSVSVIRMPVLHFMLLVSYHLSIAVSATSSVMLETKLPATSDNFNSAITLLCVLAFMYFTFKMYSAVVVKIRIHTC